MPRAKKATRESTSAVPVKSARLIANVASIVTASGSRQPTAPAAYRDQNSEFRDSPMPNHALAALRRSSVREVVVVGRRGPAQAAFTTPELRELADLDGVDVVVDPEDAVVPEWVFDDDGKNAAVKRNVETIQRYADGERAGAPKRLVLRFLSSPEEIVGRGRVAGVVLSRWRRK